MKKVLYVKPEIEVVLLKERLMLELPVSNSTVYDEAAKEGDFDDTNIWDSHESVWGKPSGKDQNWDKWSDN